MTVTQSVHCPKLMLDVLAAPKPDPIFDVLRRFEADPRPHKVNLGIGIYQTDSGETPVFEAVRQAEFRLLKDQKTKSYLGLAGDEAFARYLTGLALDSSRFGDRLISIQAAGGTGALRLLLELIAKANPAATVWMSDPTWPNHPGIVGQAGLRYKTYPYFDPLSKSVDFEHLIRCLDSLERNDVLLLHACCHNPSGADFTDPQWAKISQICAERGALPLIDVAYQGLGLDLEQDAAGLRIMAAHVPEMMLAISCSKNFGLYRERTGCAVVLAANGVTARNARSILMALGRVSYSMPPDHGAAIVRYILEDASLRNMWRDELDGMRLRMRSLRTRLADYLEARSGSDRFEYLRHHKGMFSLIGASPHQVDDLRERHGVYTIGSGRINVAGLRGDLLEFVAGAFLDVGL